MSRSISIRITLAALCSVALVAAPARASDPLLSGYGGPGSGEQALLGGGVVGGGSPGGGGSGARGGAAATSLRATAPAAAAPAPAPQGTSSDTSASGSRKPSRRRSSSSSREKMSGSTTSNRAASATPGSGSAATPLGAPRPVAYPTRAGEVGDLPLSLGGAMLLVLAAGALVLAALGLRRLTDRPHDADSTTQAPMA
jgi:hypothetical protein